MLELYDGKLSRTVLRRESGSNARDLSGVSLLLLCYKETGYLRYSLLIMQRYRSGIFWHFTGSPENIDWGELKKPADILLHGKPKSDKLSVKILIDILNSGKLIAKSEEKVSETQKSNKFCCVTDIPLKDLYIHAQYYGNVAIGFSASSIHKQFLPVIYVPLKQLPASKETIIPSEQDLIKAEESDACGLYSESAYFAERAYEYGKRILMELDENRVGSFFVNFLKITEFSSNEKETFYAEREWRHIGDFVFLPPEIEAIIVPERYLDNIKSFLNSIDQNKDKRNLSTLSWEFVNKM